MRALQKYLKPPLVPDWQYITLKKVAKLEYGAPLADGVRRHGDIPVYGSNGLVGFHDTALVKGPGIVVGRKGTAGEVVWCEKDFFPIDTTYYVNVDSELYSIRWLYYLLKHADLGMLQASTGVPGLSRPDAYKLILPVPKKDEQLRIAGLLNKVDEAMAKTEASIDAAQKLKRALMQNLLTGKLKPDGTWRRDDEFDIDPKLGRVPKGWTPVRGKALFHIHGSTASLGSRDEPVRKTCLFMKVEDFNTLGNDPFIVETEEVFEAPSSKPIYPCKPGWLVVAKRGAAISHNRVRLLKKDTVLDPNLMAIEMLGKHLSEYFRYVLLFERLARFAEVSSIPQLNNKDLYPRTFVMPTPDVQIEILKRIYSVESVVQHRNEKLVILSKLKTSLMQKLLTGKVRIPPDLVIE